MYVCVCFFLCFGRDGCGDIVCVVFIVFVL